ncbi:MAG TPA: choice-of-anchor H family protein [Woeseiaceae bacterium]|nr:choice-of-anchor H family protein [Woeseiaceae bacterium]
MKADSKPARPAKWTTGAGVLFGILLGGLVCAAPDAVSDTTVRVSQSEFFASDGRAQSVPDRVVRYERPAGVAAASADRGTPGGREKSSPQQQAPNTDFWFYTADVELFGDQDLDGYFYGIDLLFDVDTIYEYAAVYAVVYLSREGGPWLEYAETEVFDIFGATSDDEYVIVSELLEGYPTGSYDILIEVFDTYDNAFVASFGPENTPELSYLPLEDRELDVPYIPPVIIVEDGGGAADPLLLGLLMSLLAVSQALRRRSARCESPIV